MTLRVLALVLVCAVSLFGQRRRFSWQDYCFNHPAAPFCAGREYAVKPPKATKDAANSATNSLPSTAGNVAPSVIIVGGIDWRFADPLAEAVAGFRFKSLSVSPLARRLIAQLGANQGLAEPDIQKIFDAMSGVDQAALSVRGDRIVALVTGPVANTDRITLNAGLKTVPVSGNAMLAGHADAVDQALERIAIKGPPTEFTRLAEEWPASSEIWAAGAAGLIGPQAAPGGVKRFSLKVSARDRLTSDVAVEFDEAPGGKIFEMWERGLGAATLEGKIVHFRMSIEADDAQEKLGQFAASPLGQRLASLVKAARYLPVRDATIPRQARPLIHGLGGGPRELN